jgi:hypothetical protein
MENGRDKTGRFAAGNKLARNGGRKGYGIEYKALKIFNEVFDENTFRATCVQLKAHIFGQKVEVKTGKVIDDPLATPHSCLAAWTKMASYKLGMPVQPVVVSQDSDGDILKIYKEMNEEHLEKIASETEKITGKNLDELIDQANTIKDTVIDGRD